MAHELIPHLFRTEFRKISAVLCKRFGIDHLSTAEDLASETFLQALETWTYKGVPENPVAWLYVVAKNKAKNHLQRQTIYATKVASQLKSESIDTTFDIDLSDQNIVDSQLQMLFAICHPVLPAESQIGLALRILCGFGIEEIADAFLTTKETINKRLFRAREKLRVEKIPIEFPPPNEINHRLETVLTTLYLLFNEGYYSESQDEVLREDLCEESMRLTYQLIENPHTHQPAVDALYALMCFQASRFLARKNQKGELILYDDQDTSLWNYELISKGTFHLQAAARGSKLSKYHLEASIAYWHTIKADTKEKWENILQLYNQLLQVEYSPIAALNRTYALSKANSKQEAILEAEKLQLSGNPYYYALLGELYTGLDNERAKHHIQQALSLARTTGDKVTLSKKLDSM